MAILAEGSIVVSGRISMRGGDCEFAGNTVFNMPESGGNGSGGAILLRSLQCVHVTGVIDARGGVLYLAGHSTMYPYYAGDGLVRIDSYSACGAPDLTGATIQPAPFIAALPFVAELDRPRIGQTYRMVCASTPGDVLGFYYSLGTVMTPVPPFGVLELDPSMILPFGLHAVPTTGNDPLAVINLPIPSIVSLIGITFHAQMFNAFGAGNGLPRLSNRLVATIGN